MENSKKIEIIENSIKDLYDCLKELDCKSIYKSYSLKDDEMNVKTVYVSPKSIVDGIHSLENLKKTLI